MSKLAKKIAKILIDEGVLKCIPDDARIDRTRAGYWQRAAGALSWLLWWDGCTMSIGSQYPATLVAKGATVSVEMGTVILDPINLESQWSLQRRRHKAKPKKSYPGWNRTPEQQALFEQRMLRGIR